MTSFLLKYFSLLCTSTVIGVFNFKDIDCAVALILLGNSLTISEKNASSKFREEKTP